MYLLCAERELDGATQLISYESFKAVQMFGLRFTKVQLFTLASTLVLAVHLHQVILLE